MCPTIRLLKLFVLVLAVGCQIRLSLADDWPQWMGPERNGRYVEEGLVSSVPEEGLPVLWRTPIQTGYAGPAVAAGKVFVPQYDIASGTATNSPGARDELQGKEGLLCLEAASGKQLWKYEYDRPYKISYPNGPRATPAVDGDHVYMLGAEGDLLCLEVASGDLVWRKQLADTYNTEAPIWGYAAHPLVHGDLIYTLAGGKDSAVVALNKRTGQEVWSALTTSDIGYCPPVIYQLGGREVLIVWHSESVNALDPATGELHWTYPLKPSYGMSIAAPQLVGNRLYACGIGEKSVMLELDANGEPKNSLWDGRPKIGLYSGNATAIFERETIFGADCGSGKFIAVNPDDGARYWETFALTAGGSPRRANHGTAFVVRHPSCYILFTETGDLVFANLTQEGPTELGRMHVLEPTGECFGRSVVWSHPAFANRCVYARNDKEIVCVSLAETK